MIDRGDVPDDRRRLSDETTFVLAVVVTLAVALLLFFYAGKMNRATGIMAAGVGIGTAWVVRKISERIRV